MKKLFCIDVGNIISGITIISEHRIQEAANMNNSTLVEKIQLEANDNEILVLIEDISPYSLKLKQEVIDTCKFIGELTYRLRKAAINYRLILRWEIKRWIFEAFKEQIECRIVKKIDKGEFINKDGSKRKPSFVFVDDRIVAAAMKYHWDIETPKPGKSNRYGLSKHSWQALALGSFYMATSLENA